MKLTKKIIVVFACMVMGTAFLGMSSVQAEECTDGVITQTIIAPTIKNDFRSEYVISVNCLTGDWTGELKFNTIPELNDAAYATALTAMSAGMHIKTRVGKAQDHALMSQLTLIAP